MLISFAVSRVKEESEPAPAHKPRVMEGAAAVVMETPWGGALGSGTSLFCY